MGTRRRLKRDEPEAESPALNAQDLRGGEVVSFVDPANEQVVLAAATVDVGVRNDLVRRLAPDVFLVDLHRVLWTGLRELVHRGLDYDPATLQRIVGDRADVGYLVKLAEVRGDDTSTQNVSFHVRTLLWDRQRALALTGPIASLLEAVRDPKAAPERVRALSQHVADSFGQGHGASYLLSPADALAASGHAIDKLDDGPGIWPFGIEGLDYDRNGKPRLIPGAKPGKTTVVTGVSGGGKSTLTAHLLLGLARQKRRSLYGAYEMLPEEMLQLVTLISLAGDDARLEPGDRWGWTRTAVVTGLDPEGSKFFTADRRKAFDERQESIAQYVRFMRNPFRRRQGVKTTNESNLELVAQHVQDSGCDVFVADLWLRMLRYKQDDEVEDALWQTQVMAEENGFHVIALHQQRLKDIEMRPDKRPTREGMKGTSAWVDIADTILAPNIPALWKPSMPDDTLEVGILKQRFGKWPLLIALDYEPEGCQLSGGREVEYEQPGEQGGVDGFVAPVQGSRRKRGRHRG